MEGVTEYRVEKDTMGEVRVPADALWRAQTQRAVENFPVSGVGSSRPRSARWPGSRRLRRPSTPSSGSSRADVAEAIVAAAYEVAAGRHDDQFPIDTFQTGSGTSSNMNANEVIATLAARHLGGRPVHPNDHVNASQSSNDVFPSSIHLAATEAVAVDLIPALAHLMTTLTLKGPSSTRWSKRGVPTSWTPRRSRSARSFTGTARRCGSGSNGSSPAYPVWRSCHWAVRRSAPA